jgi:hypothetical protein
VYQPTADALDDAGARRLERLPPVRAGPDREPEFAGSRHEEEVAAAIVETRRAVGDRERPDLEPCGAGPLERDVPGERARPLAPARRTRADDDVPASRRGEPS